LQLYLSGIAAAMYLLLPYLLLTHLNLAFAQDQRPLREEDEWQWVIDDPLDSDFEVLVLKVLERFHVPGISITVVHGDRTFANVVPPIPLNHLHGI